MNGRLLARLIKDLGYSLAPPGCSSGFVDHPRRRDEVVEVAIVHEHRFAFFYWLKWHNARRAGAPAPDLVTLDWHDDVGGNCDFSPRTLKRLNLADEKEVAVFCWAGLRSLNDGHIAPALYLNALKDVHAIVKQDWAPGVLAPNRNGEIVDRHGYRHAIHYHRSPAAFLRVIQNRAHLGRFVIDLDLDYFTRQHPSGEHGRQIRLPDTVVRRMLDPARPFMDALLPRLAGMTIALEPEHCGGIANCAHLLDLVSSTLFRKPILSAGCSWRPAVGAGR